MPSVVRSDDSFTFSTTVVTPSPLRWATGVAPLLVLSKLTTAAFPARDCNDSTEGPRHDTFDRWLDGYLRRGDRSAVLTVRAGHPSRFYPHVLLEVLAASLWSPRQQYRESCLAASSG